MEWTDIEATAFANLWRYHGKRPTTAQYRAYVEDNKQYPSIDDLTRKWGSYFKALQAFETLQRITREPNPKVDDYLLGCLISRAKVVYEGRGRRAYLRFVLNDEAQLEYIRTMLGKTTVCRNTRFSQYVRCYDEPLIAFWELHNLNDHPEAAFRRTVDFVRGYIETHSHLQQTAPGRKRLTLVGPLVAKCRAFLVKLGATDTKAKVFYRNEKEDHPRVHIHSKSLHKIRDKLYPPGCACYEPIRQDIYHASPSWTYRKSDLPR